MEAVDLDRLVRRALDGERELSAVERFSRLHDDGGLAARERYRELLPAAPLARGEQYAFEVDLDACTGCKSCVVACHTRNGLDPGEVWREVGLLVGVAAQPVTAACHHCLEPACLDGCPVRAYEKDAATGVVRHLDDQCIGCGYCTLTCPYEVPRWNERLGIVRKCDLCTGRLAEGEAPACAEACPTRAIRVVAVDAGEVARAGAAAAALPGTPDPRLTLPTTRYRRREPLPRDVHPLESEELRAAKTHPSLAAMLVLTQLSVGTVAVGEVLAFVAPAAARRIGPTLLAAALAFMLSGLAASVFHLGRPLAAWKALLGIRTSWLSREILAFGVYAALLGGTAALARVAPESAALVAARLGTLATGLGAVACSVLVYDRTRRAPWRWTRVLPAFLATAAALGIATVWTIATALGVDAGVRGGLALALVVAVAAELALAASTLYPRFLSSPPARERPAEGRAGGRLLGAAREGSVRHASPALPTEPGLDRAAALLRGPLRKRRALRLAAAVVGGVLMPLGLLDGPHPSAAGAALAALALAAGELLERDLFFRSAVSPARLGGRTG